MSSVVCKKVDVRDAFVGGGDDKTIAVSKDVPAEKGSFSAMTALEVWLDGKDCFTL